MSHEFDTFQRNMLLTGRELYAEIASSSEDTRVFVRIWGYRHDPLDRGGRLASVFLNADHSDNRYGLQVTEVSKDALQHMIYLFEDATDLEFRNNIAGLDDLAELLGRFLPDFSRLASALPD